MTPLTLPRPRAGQRARWLAARTRNAARHGLLIASVGALVVVAALLLFVLVPRQVDRALAAQIAALPPERDTLSLHVELRAARRELTRLETSITAAALATRADATADSVLEQARGAAADLVFRTERALVDAAALNDDLRATRDALRARMQLDLPPTAMLLASLVLGLVLGFAYVLWRELRRPTVGDEQELEALTRTRVIVHRSVAASVLAVRARRRGDEMLPLIMQHTDAAWPLLHLTLSSIGDVSRYVEVVADQPVLAGAVALNLSAVAAHESRATVLVDAVLVDAALRHGAPRHGALVSLLAPSVLTSVSDTSAPMMASTAARGTSGHTPWDAPRSLAIGRDTFIDIVLPRRERSRHTGDDLSASTDADCLDDALQRLAAHHDLVVFITDLELDAQVPPDTDVVLCARLGVTTLDWLSRTLRQLEARKRRVRAVVLWATDLPLAG